MSEIIVIMEGGSSAPDDSIINVAETVASSIKMNPLWSHGFRASPQSCIFTVSESLSRHNEVAYKPKTFSIGPLHHSVEHLKHSKTIKFQYLRDLVSRVGVQVQDLTTAVANLEPQAREHYREQINFSSAEFVEIMVIDGCFLIEFFRKGEGTVVREPNDPLFSMTNIQQELCEDIMLLENQIPWMILDRLFTMTIGEERRLYPESSLVHHALNFLKVKFSFFAVNFQQEVFHNLESENCRHLLDLARYVLIQNTSGLKESYQRWEPIPTAAELENFGVTLKKSEASGLTILFKDGVLEMSPLHIYDETESVIRNIIALEQCSTNYTTILSSYVFILEDLIKTTKDIDCLSSSDIIKVNINPDDALGFFNKIGSGVTTRGIYYPNIGPPLNAYCRRRWPKWRAMLYRNYLSNPWVIISMLAAFALLVFACLQTIYTMQK